MYVSIYGFHFLFIIILVVLLPLHFSSAVELCPPTTCGGGYDDNPPSIHFPFRLRHRQSRRCGYPGFILSCGITTNETTQPQTLLHIPNSGPFTVQHIDYAAQTIDLNDPDECLPRRLLNFSLGNSPFRAQNPQDFTLFNCSADVVESAVRSRLLPIPCMSEGNYTVYYVPTMYYKAYLGSVPCNEVGMVTVPLPWSFWLDINEDMRLSWDVPDCQACLARGGNCGYRDGNSTEIDCSRGNKGLTRGAKYGLIIGAGVPGLLLTVGLISLLYGKIKNIRRDRGAPTSTTSTLPMLGGQRSVVSIGLDELTIESYPKIELGASRRLPKPNDNTCAICLGEYQAKETLRTIPECNHYFHAECIDEWLRINTTCPVCRNSPERSSLGTSNSSLSPSTSLVSSEN